MKKSLLILPIALGAVIAQADDSCITWTAGATAVKNQCYTGYSGYQGLSESECFKVCDWVQDGAVAPTDQYQFNSFWEKMTCPQGSSTQSSASTESSNSTVTSSTSTETSSNSTVTSSASTAGSGLFDDFEDGNTTAEEVAADAYWYLYKAGGTITNEQDATKTWDMIVSDGGNSYATMKGIGGITSGATTYPSVGMGIDFGAGTLAQCTAIQYDYKGSGHHLRGLVDGVTKDKGYEHVAPNQKASNGWTTVTVSTMTQPDWVAEKSPSDVKTFSWAGVKGLAWVVDEKLDQADIGTELDIDNVKCVGTLTKVTTPTSSNSSTTPTSNSSTTPTSNSSTTPTSNSSTTPASNGSATPDAIGVVAAPAGLSATVHGNTLQVTVAKSGLVKVQVFDMMGHSVESSESMVAGSFAYTFGKMGKGAYIVRVQQGSMVKTIRMQVR